MVGNLTKKNKKCQMPGGQPGGQPGGEAKGTFGFDSYIKIRVGRYVGLFFYFLK